MAKSKKLPVFKHIVKRLQKRKDKKKVYYYYNKTDKKQTSKAVYNDSLKVRKVFKEKYGKDWLKKYYSGVTQIKQIEKAEKKHSLTEIEKIIKDYQKKTGFPNTKDFINFSGEAEMTKNLISDIPSFIHYNNRYYKLEKTDILELNAFFFYVIDTFMNALRKSYTGKAIKTKTKKGLSPFCLFPISEFINLYYPEVFVLHLQDSYSSEGFDKLIGLFNDLIRQGFNEYLFNLPVYNIYEFIYKSKK